MNPEAYPTCDWCGECEHCPTHIGDKPCSGCWGICQWCHAWIAFDTPGCPDMFCDSWKTDYLDEVNSENF